MQLDELARALDATLVTQSQDQARRSIERVNTLKDAAGNEVSFLTNPTYASQVATTRAGAVIAHVRTYESHREKFRSPALLVAVEGYATVARAIALLHPPQRHSIGVSALAVVHPEAVLAEQVCIMPQAYVGRARLGRGVVVYPHAYIGDDVEVGEDSVVYPHATLLRGTRVGARAILHAGCVLGADGFGFAPTASGHVQKVPQVGTVAVGDDVEIGACTTVDRAALGTTVLGNQVKLDNQVQIGHNCVLGDAVLIAGNTAIAGSARLGDHVMVGGCSAVSGHLTVGKGARLGGFSATMHDIPEGESWAGMPAVRLTSWARQVVLQRRLDEHIRLLKALGTRVAELEAALVTMSKQAAVSA